MLKLRIIRPNLATIVVISLVFGLPVTRPAWLLPVWLIQFLPILWLGLALALAQIEIAPMPLLVECRGWGGQRRYSCGGKTSRYLELSR